MRQETFFSLSNEIKTKNESAVIKRNEIWRKSKRARGSVSIDIVIFAFLYWYSCICISVITSTKTCRQKLNEMLSFLLLIFENFFFLLFRAFLFFSLLSRHISSHGKFSKKKLFFFNILQYSQEDICVGATL